MSARVLLAVVLLLCACKGVGRSLVDTQAKHGERSSSCAPPPACAGLGLAAGAMLSEQRPALTGINPAVCSGDCSTMPSGSSTPAVGEDCAQVWNVDEQRPSELSDLSCSGLRITSNPYGQSTEVTIAEARWSGVELTIESTRPITVHLRAPNLEDVNIALSGPVTLDVLEQGYLHRVQISAAVTQQVAPTVSISDSTLESVSILREGGSFPGAVTISRGGHVSESWLSADRLELNNLSMHNVVTEARVLDSDDVQFHHATLSFDDGKLSFCSLYDTRVRSCTRGLTVAGSDVHDSELAACKSDRLRFYKSVADQVSVAGNVDSEDATWTRSLFSGAGPLTLLTYRSRFDRVNFCAEEGQIGFAGNDNALSCSECAGRTPTCRDADAEVQLNDVACPELSPIAVCEHSLPPAGRPSQ